MYEQFFGLTERPFDLTTNPRFLFLTARHREALSTLQFGITGRKGLTLLLGEAGTGKTTLTRCALDLVREHRVKSVYVSNPTLTREEFYEFVAAGFQLGDEAGKSKTQFLLRLNEATLDWHRAGGISTLVIDEAQSLSFELLEEVRLLSNLETAYEKMLPTVLIGQPELADRLNEPRLRQLKQRIALRCSLEPLDLRETAAYITKRVRIAGGDSGELFTKDAVVMIHERSKGVPRTINVICDNALVTAFAMDRRPVDVDVVVEVTRDLDLDVASPPMATTAIPPRPVHKTLVPTAHHAEAPGPTEAATGTDDDRGGMFSNFSKRRRFSFF